MYEILEEDYHIQVVDNNGRDLGQPATNHNYEQYATNAYSTLSNSDIVQYN